MIEKINASKWLPWVISLCITVLLSFLISITADWTGWLAIYPLTVAEAVASIAAIDQFKLGIPTVEHYWNYRAAALLGICIFFVAGPSLWIFGETKKSEKKSGSWYAGTALTMFAIYMFASGIVSSIKRDQRVDQMIKINQNMDELKSELLTIAYRAMEQYWVPEEAGGSGRDFDELQELKKALESDNTFVISRMNSDSVITIYGIGKTQGKDPDFENINGRSGRIQAAIKVMPVRHNIDWIKSASN